MTGRWQIWIDRGGTFTDCIGRDPESGHVRIVKLLSSSDDEAPVLGARRLLGLGPDEPLPPELSIRMGTTLATNALLERTGARTGLVITWGFGDLPRIGDQARPELFALAIAQPEPLHAEVLEVDARVDADGQVLRAVDPVRVRAGLQALRSRGVTSLAIALIHAYTPGGAAQERAVADEARALGFDHVSCSHEVAHGQGLLARVETTIVDAYLTPRLRAYSRRLQARLPAAELRFMQSSGELCAADSLRGRNAILSGPAGGVVAVAELAHRQALGPVIGFDMGGTSTDVSRVGAGGARERVYGAVRVAGVRVRTPMMAIHTVAAGGGSICRYDGQRFSVGPESVGAEPGPLCYGHPEGRALALTDISLALGRLLPHRFPMPITRARTDAALTAVAARVGLSPLATAQGFFEVAIGNMAAAIRTISVARGHDVREHAMVVFGGAGGQYACAVARRLGVRRLVFHPFAGVLSAHGMGVARVGWHGEADAGRRLVEPGVEVSLEPLFAALTARGREHTAGAGAGSAEVSRRVDLRYRGTQVALTLPYPDAEGAAVAEALTASFTARHRQEFGYARDGHPIEVTAARVEVTEPRPPPRPLARWAYVGDDSRSNSKGSAARVPATVAMWGDGRDGLQPAPVILREDLPAGAVTDGPALILEATGTIALDPGWRLERGEDDCLVARDLGVVAEPRAVTSAARAGPDPVSLEIMGNRFMAIAEQMGVVLQRTALSTNIRERLDFSCAVFDREGGLVANAPHIPVHLGAMGESIRGVLAAHPRPRPGDVYATNDPAAGGSHLPDITVITPVHDDDGRLQFFTASRGHHADIGGLTPGSMPPHSRALVEEGVVLSAVPIVRGGAFDRAGFRTLLSTGPYPARDPDQNIADLEAQIAANQTGARLLGELARARGADEVASYMGYVQDHGAACVARAIAATVTPGVHRFEDAMDDGTTVAVTITAPASGDRLIVDFTGTGAEQEEGNLNAPRAVAVAAVLYVVRLLAGRPIPLNQGCLRPVTLVVPPGCLLNPGPGRAVVAGNVETAQRVVDVLLGALGLAAASQGTMNNLTFGDSRLAYYETIGGGAGACATAPGASGVHTHMTNTRITDPEVLESRFPVRLVEFSLRAGSGGEGAQRGGDGLVRELEFLRPVRVSMLGERRRLRPFGLRGGSAGAAGRTLHNGRALPGRFAALVGPGDRIRIETPGGGGFGSP